MNVALKKLKNKRSPGVEGITNELLKYGGESIIEQLLILINRMLQSYKIPDEWRISKTILLFKKGDKEVPSNYRGINLLPTALKLTTRILSLRDEQQGFRSGRSCTDAVFVIRQITEKSIENNQAALQLKDVIHFLLDR